MKWWYLSTVTFCLQCCHCTGTGPEKNQLRGRNWSQIHILTSNGAYRITKFLLAFQTESWENGMILFFQSLPLEFQSTSDKKCTNLPTSLINGVNWLWLVFKLQSKGFYKNHGWFHVLNSVLSVRSRGALFLSFPSPVPAPPPLGPSPFTDKPQRLFTQETVWNGMDLIMRWKIQLYAA